MGTCHPKLGLASSAIQVVTSLGLACWICGGVVRGVSSTEVEGKSGLLADVSKKVELFT